MILNKNSRIYIAGHSGMVGSAVYNLLKKKKYKNIITISRHSLDLTNQKKTYNFLKKTKPNFVIIAAAKVGGILINQKNKADFIYQNLTMQNNLIHSSYKAGVKKLIFLGSSCIYPKFSNQPISEKELLNGKLEVTNQAYAIAKISGIEMCRSYNIQYKTNYKCLMPTNLYGPNDNYNLESSHFFAAAIRKLFEAKKNNKKSLTFWGTGNSKREAMFVDDLADAIVFFLNKKTKENLINIGSNYELKIRDFLKLISKLINYEGRIKFDNNRSIDGTPRKIVNTNLAKKLGWKSKHNFEKSMLLTINDFIKNYKGYIK